MGSYPFALIFPALSGLVPPLLVALGLAGVVSQGVLTWASTVTAANLLWWLAVYAWFEESPLYALLHPLGAAALLYISLRAIVRGRRVAWKGRDYRVA